MSFNQEVYRAGDFAYIEPTERGMEYSVVLIERLWTNAESQQMLYGNLFYRPSETYHVASRKFLDKELFKSDAHVAVPLAKVAGRCCVLSVKDYFRMQPEGFLEKDVYVCESRYSTKARAFKKIKVWNFDPDHLKLNPRDKPLEPKRVISVYKERLEKHKEEIAELEEGEKLMEKERPVSKESASFKVSTFFFFVFLPNYIKCIITCRIHFRSGYKNRSGNTKTKKFI